MRALKVLVVVMGVLIVAGTVALVAVLVQRMSAVAPRGVERLEAADPAAPVVRVDGSLGQPPGSRILGVAGAGGRVALWVARPDGERVLLLDPRSGAVSAEFRLGD